jgi:indole-3-acetate monooxygenase
MSDAGVAVAARTSTSEGVLRAVEDLSPSIGARAAEIEAARRMPRDLLDDLIDTGCFRLLLPESHGGASADASTSLAVIEALARADASTAWIVMIGSGAWLDLAGLPRATFDALFTDDAIVAGVFNPAGSIEPGDDGYHVTGRWSFASGCEHASVIYGNCLEGVVDGVPQLRIAVFRPEDVVIEDTWRVSGLQGTGSHHFHVDDVVVPVEHTTAPLADEPSMDTPIVRIPPPTLFPLMIASVSLGIAQGALDDIVDLAQEKVPLLAGGTLATSPLFQSELADAATELRAARGLLHDTAAAVWATALDRSPYTLEQRAEARSAAVWATERAVAIVDFAYRSGGGSSIYAESPLQRRLRDVHAVTQHFLVKRETLVTAGAIFARQDVDVMVF